MAVKIIDVENDCKCDQKKFHFDTVMIESCHNCEFNIENKCDITRWDLQEKGCFLQTCHNCNKILKIMYRKDSKKKLLLKKIKQYFRKNKKSKTIELLSLNKIEL